MLRALRPAALALAVAVFFPVALLSNQKPVRLTIVDPPPVPQSFEMMYQRSDAVALVEVVGKGAPELADGRKTPYVIRKQRARIIEPLKGANLAMGQEITIVQLGGSVVTATEEIKTNYPVTLLEPGDRVLVFLVRWAQTGSFAIAHGSAGKFSLKRDQDAFDVPAEAKGLSVFANRSQIDRETLLNTLRNMKGGR